MWVLQPTPNGALEFSRVVTTNSFGKSARFNPGAFGKLTSGSEIFREFMTAEVHFIA
jgi:hypothetical protein